MRSQRLLLLLLCIVSSSCSGPPVDTRHPVAAADPLPSWNEGAARKALVDFVARTTTQGASDFVAPAERVAVFDNDGTLWAEQPMYTQLAFALDRIEALAPKYPEWKTTQPFKGVIDGDIKAVLSQPD